MTLSEKFDRIRLLDKDLIPEAKEDYDRMYAAATATTPRYDNDGSQHINNSNNKEKAFAECAALSVKIDKLQDELAGLILNVEKQIDTSIANDKQRRFAKLYYIDHIAQKKIAQKVRYEYGTVRNNLTEFRKSNNLVTSSDTK